MELTESTMQKIEALLETMFARDKGVRTRGNGATKPKGPQTISGGAPITTNTPKHKSYKNTRSY